VIFPALRCPKNPCMKPLHHPSSCARARWAELDGVLPKTERTMQLARTRFAFWYDKNCRGAARFYAEDLSRKRGGCEYTMQPVGLPIGKKGDCAGPRIQSCRARLLYLGHQRRAPRSKHSEGLFFQIATDDQPRTDRFGTAHRRQWGARRARAAGQRHVGWSCQITPRVLTEAMGGPRTMKQSARLLR